VEPHQDVVSSNPIRALVVALATTAEVTSISVKRIYKIGMDRLRGALDAAMQAAREDQSRRVRRVLLISGAMLPLLLAVWF
jgi:hypothetical protein